MRAGAAVSAICGKAGTGAGGIVFGREDRCGGVSGDWRIDCGAGSGASAAFARGWQRWGWRDASGTMTLRRGFTLQPDQRVLVVEDVWTTGGSTQEAIHVVEEAGGRVVAAGALIDRSGGKIEFPVESNALLELTIESYEEEDCPLCKQGSAAVKPGSRFARTAS